MVPPELLRRDVHRGVPLGLGLEVADHLLLHELPRHVQDLPLPGVVHAPDLEAGRRRRPRAVSPGIRRGRPPASGAGDPRDAAARQAAEAAKREHGGGKAGKAVCGLPARGERPGRAGRAGPGGAGQGRAGPGRARRCPEPRRPRRRRWVVGSCGGGVLTAVVPCIRLSAQ